MPRNAAYLVSDPSRLPEGLLSSTSVPPTDAFGTSTDHKLGPFMHSHNRTEKPEKAAVEILNSNELALRLKVKESWVIEQSKRSRTADPACVRRRPGPRAARGRLLAIPRAVRLPDSEQARRRRHREGHLVAFEWSTEVYRSRDCEDRADARGSADQRQVRMDGRLRAGRFCDLARPS